MIGVDGVHRVLEDVLARVRASVLLGDGVRAAATLAIYRTLVAEHAAAEERELLAIEPAARRWPDELYVGQHHKLLAAIDRVAGVLAALDAPRPGWPARALAVLDAAGPLVHLVEHHHRAEEDDLFPVVARHAPARLAAVAAAFDDSYARVSDALVSPPAAARTFAIFLDGDARPDAAAIAAHVAHLRALDDRGALVVCGPFVDGGGLVCVRAASAAEARVIADADPFVARGLRTARVRELEAATRGNGYLA